MTTSNFLRLKYCPFCGKQLTPMHASGLPDQPQFAACTTLGCLMRDMPPLDLSNELKIEAFNTRATPVPAHKAFEAKPRTFGERIMVFVKFTGERVNTEFELPLADVPGEGMHQSLAAAIFQGYQSVGCLLEVSEFQRRVSSVEVRCWDSGVTIVGLKDLLPRCHFWLEHQGSAAVKWGELPLNETEKKEWQTTRLVLAHEAKRQHDGGPAVQLEHFLTTEFHNSLSWSNISRARVVKMLELTAKYASGTSHRDAMVMAVELQLLALVLGAKELPKHLSVVGQKC